MSITMQEHLRESVLKTALFHLLKNSQKSPDRTARNILELLCKFDPGAGEVFCLEELVQTVKKYSREECLSLILKKLSV